MGEDDVKSRRGTEGGEGIQMSDMEREGKKQWQQRVIYPLQWVREEGGEGEMEDTCSESITQSQIHPRESPWDKRV